MLKAHLFFSLIVFSLSSKSQSVVAKNTSYFDKNGKLTYVESAFYFRQNTDTLDYYRSFYSDTKNKYFEGSIINNNDTMDYNNKYKGICKWYYSNGILKVQSEYNNVGVLNGLKNEFNTEGKLIKSSVYENGKLKDKKFTEFNSNGRGINVFKEEFADNSSNWYLNSDAVRSSKIRIGGLELMNKEKNDYALFINYKIDSLNFSIETNINSNYLSLDTKAGFVFNYKDGNNYNYFFISKNRVHIGYKKNGIKSMNFDDRFSEHLKGFDWNNIKIACSHDSVVYIINNKIIMINKMENLFGEKIGLTINNGMVMFDNLVIKQSQDQVVDADLLAKKFCYYNDEKYPLKAILSGVLLGEQGYVLSCFKNIDISSKFIVSAYVNDTLKRFFAEIYLKNDFENSVVFKIINPQNYKFQKTIFAYQYLKSVESEKDYIYYYLKKNEVNNDFESIAVNGDLKYDSPHDHNVEELKYYGHSCIGAPVFDKSGNILGLIENVNESSKIKIRNMQSVMQILFSHPEVYKAQKTLSTDYSEFNQKIHKNLVIIEVM